jgi:octaprenyl-diphosphate synthase
MTVPCLAAVARSASPELLDTVVDDIRAVEFVMAAELNSDVETVERLGNHVMSAGGKRLRPAMVGLSARAIGKPYRTSRVHTIGAAMEMVHMATLMHDDVIDEAKTRRGRPTVNAIAGNRASILTGDVILSKAMRLIVLDGDIDLMHMVADAVVAMTEGEVAEVESLGRLDMTPEDHFEIVRKKTAVFIEACCRAGAIIAGANEQQQERLGDYGYHVGMAFQFADDILDFKGDPLKTGKAVGGDFREGCATLPLIHALGRASEGEQAVLRHYFGRDSEGGAMRSVVDVIDKSGGFDHTRELAIAHSHSAMASLAVVSASTARECLISIADFAISRDR